jgi:hypothetical protein
MSTLKIRFNSAREVFEAFPSAGNDIEASPTDDEPLAFLRQLLTSRTPEDAVAFCAYVLPRREAVWWAAQCVRRLAPTRTSDEEAALVAAEAWVREPEEGRRYEALRLGMTSNRAAPATWVALAAAWSGGSMTAPEEGVSVPAPPELTAKAARAAILTALARIGTRERAAYLGNCIEAGVRLAGGSPSQG